MSEERGPIEPLSARLPHSFKHHIRYLNRSFWQGRQGQTFSFSQPIDVLHSLPLWFPNFFFFFPLLFFPETHRRQLCVGNAWCLDSSKQPFSLAPTVMLFLKVWVTPAQCVILRELTRQPRSWHMSPMTLEVMRFCLWSDSGQIWHN